MMTAVNIKDQQHLLVPFLPMQRMGYHGDIDCYGPGIGPNGRALPDPARKKVMDDDRPVLPIYDRTTVEDVKCS